MIRIAHPEGYLPCSSCGSLGYTDEQAQHEAICLLERKLSEDIHDKHNFPETKVSDDGDVGC